MQKATVSFIVLSFLSVVAYGHVKALKAENARKEAIIQQLAVDHLWKLEDAYRAELEAVEALRKETPISVRLQLPKLAIVTAYTCDPSMTPQQKAINCPNGITATGSVPKDYRTAACDTIHKGKRFKLDPIGIVECEDTGSLVKDHIRGGLAIDLFMPRYADAMSFGKRSLPYTEIE